MKLYKISQTMNNGWDTYDAAIVVAESEEQARIIYPNPDYIWCHAGWCRRETGTPLSEYALCEWTTPKYVQAECIGETQLPPGTVVLASFHAG